eukprot:CAMPEP_0203746876 /NCGR_PEP_ID=MMETSP0098-20131031/2188_1 /ASSEMBLY_ACC=CAM_ASM_000208 /TAXON_ID=96639 /ORGANISM=" , Strain NY0313808BC1" /LENGTH=477 /DNA_ID=CAMNT_0050635129 /DNA_START=334 /DNA_END=1767 /DNA_ORIENTATION=-
MGDALTNANANGGAIQVCCELPQEGNGVSKIENASTVSLPEILEGNTKYLVLFVSAFASFSEYYAMDNPSALYAPGEVYMGTTGMMSYDYFVNLMYTFVGVPNIVWGLLVGPVINRYGLAKSFPASVLAALVGQIIVAVGIQVRIEVISLIGRILLGVALEFSGCAMLALISIWMGNHVAFGMAIFSTANRLGTVVNNVVSLKIANKTGVPFAYWFSGILLMCASIGSLLIYKLEKRREKEVFGMSKVSPEQSNENLGFFRSLVKQLKRLPYLYWVCNVNAGLILGISLVFNNTASALVIERTCGGACCPAHDSQCDAHKHAEERAAFLMSIPYLVTIIGGPILGMIVDRVGLRVVIAQFGWMLVMVVFSLFSFTEIGNEYLFPLLGVALAVVMASSFPCVPMVVEERDVAAAFALVLVAQSILTAIMPLFVAMIQQKTDSYVAVQPLFLGLACFGFFDVAILNYLDWKQNFRLNKP